MAKTLRLLGVTVILAALFAPAEVYADGGVCCAYGQEYANGVCDTWCGNEGENRVGDAFCGEYFTCICDGSHEWLAVDCPPIIP